MIVITESVMYMKLRSKFSVSPDTKEKTDCVYGVPVLLPGFRLYSFCLTRIMAGQAKLTCVVD